MLVLIVEWRAIATKPCTQHEHTRQRARITHHTLDKQKKMASANVLCVVFFCIVLRVGGENMCPGSICVCQRGTDAIVCNDGYIQYVDNELKREVVSVTMRDNDVMKLKKMDLSEYINLKKLVIEIPDDVVCDWVEENSVLYRTITFIVLPSDMCVDPPESPNNDNAVTTFTIPELLGISGFFIVILLLLWLTKMLL